MERRIDRLLFQRNPQPMWVYDPQTLCFLAVNEAAVQHYGWSEQEFLALTLRDIRPPEDVPALVDDVARKRVHLHGGDVWRHRKRNGQLIWVDIVSHSLPFEGRECRLVVAHDISERVLAMQALQRSEARWERLFAASAIGIASAGLDGLFSHVNPAYCQLVGRTEAQVLGLHMFAFTHADDIAACERLLPALLAGERDSFVVEKRYLRPDGQPVWVRVAVTVTPSDGAGTERQLVAAVQDIDAQRHAQQALDRQHELLGLAGRLARLGGWEWRRSPPGVVWTDELRNILGLLPDDPAGLEQTLDWYTPESRPRIRAALQACMAEGTAFDLELHMQTPAAKRLAVRVLGQPTHDASGQIVGMRGALLDQTERAAMTEQLQQSQRLEAVGQLTGGVAHDFNNLLTVILGNADLLAEQLADQPALLPLAQMTRSAAERGAALTQRLLAFARKQALQPQAVDTHQLLAGMDGLLRRTLPEDIDLELVRAAGLWPALVDPAQLESAVLNLVLNARDAMPGGGRLTIETANAWIDQAYAEQHAEVSPGQYVLVTISDTGCGMTAAQLARAFEPFYTTKPTGKGTGLGLSMVYGFAKQSSGHLKLYSEPGEGTTARLYLPRAPVDRPATAPAAEAVTDAGLRGHELVLVVEDDDLVRRHGCQLLAGLGYRVLQAATGAEALALLQAHADIDLLFTDVVMPGGMNGRQLADAARSLRPGLKVLYSSGYTENAIVHHGRLDPGVHLLAKPYRSIDLARKLRAVLARGA